MNQISFKNLTYTALCSVLGMLVYHYFVRETPDVNAIMDICFGMFSLIGNTWIFTKLGLFDEEPTKDSNVGNKNV